MVSKSSSPSISAWKRGISSKIVDAILAGAADHRQYPNPEEDKRIKELNDQEFNNYQKIAARDGFSLENPSAFFIQHVYPIVAEKVLELTLRTKLAERSLQQVLPERSIEEWPQRAVSEIMEYLEEKM